MKFYISGPMSGMPEHNFPAFDGAAEVLRSAGFEVVNPADLDRADPLPKGTPREVYLRRDIPYVCQCNALVMLPGWLNSWGATFEADIAKRLGMPLLTYQVIPFGTKIPERDLWGYRKVRGRSEQVALYQYRETVLQEAERLVSGDRGASYGHPLDDMDCSGAIATAILQHKKKLHKDAVIQAEDMCLIMQGVKIARECVMSKRDNRVDGPGYWKCLDMVIEERGRRAAEEKAARIYFDTVTMPLQEEANN